MRNNGVIILLKASETPFFVIKDTIKHTNLGSFSGTRLIMLQKKKKKKNNELGTANGLFNVIQRLSLTAHFIKLQ